MDEHYGLRRGFAIKKRTAMPKIKTKRTKMKNLVRTQQFVASSRRPIDAFTFHHHDLCPLQSSFKERFKVTGAGNFMRMRVGKRHCATAKVWAHEEPCLASP